MSNTPKQLHSYLECGYFVVWFNVAHLEAMYVSIPNSMRVSCVRDNGGHTRKRMLRVCTLAVKRRHTMWEPNELRGTWLVPNYYDVATYVDDVIFYRSIMEPLYHNHGYNVVTHQAVEKWMPHE